MDFLSKHKRPKLARYQCLTCGHIWEQKPGWATCPVCVRSDPALATWKDHYCKWLNFEEMFGHRR